MQPHHYIANEIKERSGVTISRSVRLNLPLRRGSPVHRILFLDLDDTIIPTSFIVRTISSSRNVPNVNAYIRDIISASGLFTALRRLFEIAREAGMSKIAVVTNAARRTVEQTYLQILFPELKVLFDEFAVSIIPTEKWLEEMGPAPHAGDTERYKSYYTHAKRKVFDFVISEFSQYIKNNASSLGSADISSENEKAFKVERRPTFDIFTIGDQFCEMGAALGLGGTYEVRRLYLLLILEQHEDFIPPPPNQSSVLDKSGIACELEKSQTPVSFVRQITRMTCIFEHTVAIPLETSCRHRDVYQSNICSIGLDVDVACWIPLHNNFVLSAGCSTLFNVENGPFFLPTKYLVNTQEDPTTVPTLHEEDRKMFAKLNDQAIILSEKQKSNTRAVIHSNPRFLSSTKLLNKINYY